MHEDPVWAIWLGAPGAMRIYEVCMKEFVGNHVLILLEKNPYPEDYRVFLEAKTLTTAGYYVSVICPRGPGQPWYEVLNGVRVYRYPRPPAGHSFLGYVCEYGYSMVAIFVLSLLVCSREGCDIVHTHNPPDTFIFIAAFYKLLGKRYIYDHVDLVPEMYYPRFGGRGHRLVYHILVFLEKLSCRLADHVISVNQSVKQIAMQRGHVPEERITIVRNGPDLQRRQPVAPTPRPLGNTIIGYAGIMGFQDGVDYLLRALHRLIYDLGRTDVSCILIGGGDAWASLKTLATQLRLDEYVWFSGWVSPADLVRYISTVDICTAPEPSNPYNDRSTMIKMAEYMALEKPIVAFDLPEHRITAQDAAVYACPNDEMDFARHIAALMDNPEQRQYMGQRGRARVETELAWTNQEKHLLKAYSALT
jgi:glycosyltransferase involved in cell wall biosynthesis